MSLASNKDMYHHPRVKHYRRPPKCHKEHERAKIHMQSEHTNGCVTEIQLPGRLQNRPNRFNTPIADIRAQGALVGKPSTEVHLLS